MRTALLLLLALVPAPAYATVLLPADFVSMVREAHAIVRGRIVDVRSEAPAGRGTIVSMVTLQVDDTLKGTAASRVTLRVPGGELGRYRRIMVGAPVFVPGDEVILFLAGRAPSMPSVYGLSQGVYRIDRRSGQALVTPPPVLARGLAAERVVRGDPARQPLPVDVFAGEVRAILERAR